MLQKRLLKSVLLTGDVGVFYLSIFLALFLRHFELPSASLLNVHIISFTPLIVFWIFTFYLSGLYDKKTVFFKKTATELLFLAHSINIALAAVFFFVLPFGISPKLLLAIYFLSSFALLIFWRVFIFPALFKNHKVELLLFTNKKMPTEILDSLRDDLLFPVKLGKFDLRDENDDLKRQAAKRNKNSVIVLLDEDALLESKIFERNENWQKLLNFSMSGSIAELYDLLGVIDPKNMPARVLFEILRGKSSLYVFSKKVFDFTVAIFLLPVFALLSAFVAVFVWLDSGRPVIYKSVRVGLSGKRFTLYKFRTMTGTDSGKEALNSKLKVTRAGAFLRKSRLDELPQIINVFKGELSFVGPRPEIPELVELYEKEIPFYSLRQLAPPGLSGWAQLKQTKHPHHFADKKATEEKLAYDLFYLKERGLFFDIKIFIQSILILLKLKGR